MTWWTDWGKDALLAALALYGATLSTFNWRHASRKEKRNIVVSASSAIPTYHDGSLGKTFARIEAVNAGQRKVTITSLGFKLEDGKRLVSLVPNHFPGIQDTTLPVTLDDGEKAFLFFAYEALGEGLAKAGKKKVIPYCEDSVGTVYEGKAWRVDPTEFMRM